MPFSAALMMIACGCATTSDTPRPWDVLATFPAEESDHRIAVFGDLGTLLPAYDATPWLDTFLYGPNDVGKLPLRNPQGMARLGGRLLIGDQGYPAVAAIDMASGRSVPWQDMDHAPRCPVDVAVGSAGRVYVADTTFRAVLVYEATGRFVQELRPPDDPDERFRPTAIVADKSMVYVADAGRRRIERWEAGASNWLPPLEPSPHAPGMLAPAGLCLGVDGTLLIADAMAGRVHRVNASGQWLDPISRPGRLDGELVRPKQICCTSAGLVLVADAGRQSVVAFDSDGAFVTEVHGQVGRWGGWTLPAGLLALPAGALPVPEHAELSTRPDAWVIVSDALGGVSLTLLGVWSSRAKGGTDGP